MQRSLRTFYMTASETIYCPIPPSSQILAKFFSKSFGLYSKRKHLQHRSMNILSSSLFRQWQAWTCPRGNIHVFFFGQHTPMFQNFLIVSTKPINADDTE